MTRMLPGALALILWTTPALAQGWIEIENPRRPEIGSPVVVRTGSEVRTALDGPVLRVEVEEHFRNTGGSLAEGSYLYPLPGEAVFQNFSLWMGDQELRGEMLNAEKARAIYEEIVRRRRDPALLTLAGHGLVRAQVFPIQPGETRKVVVRYTEVLERVGEAFRIRYQAGARGGKAGSWRLTAVDSDRFGTPYSPTHELDSRRDRGRLEISADIHAGGDLVLFLPLSRPLAAATVVTHAPGGRGEEGYAMLLLAPPGTAAGPSIPRDLTFVLDISGSMSGRKIEQARAAVKQALGTLRTGDRFRLVAFSTGVRQFRDGWSPATPGALDGAAAWLDGLAAEGGTNIEAALETALEAQVPEARLPLLLFLTDGLPSVGEQQPDRIAARVEARVGRARVFAFGVGHDVNTYLLDRLARDGRGATEYVPPDGNVEAAVGTLMSKLERPALVNLRIVESPVRFRDLAPARLPDLFHGEELVIFGRYEGSGSGRVVFEGEREGRRVRFETEAAFPRVDSENDFIPRLWAARRIGELTRQIRLEGGTPELIAEVRDLGLRHGVLTEYTSYLVQEPDQPVATREERQARRALQEVPMAPASQSGVMAFDRARESNRMSGAANLAAADSFSLAGATRAGDASLRRAGGRIFRLKGDVWTDLAHADSLRVVTVTAFSPAYFAVLRALPEVSPFLPVGESVLIAGRRASLQVSSGGRSALSGAELKEFVRAFRGAA